MNKRILEAPARTAVALVFIALLEGLGGVYGLGFIIYELKISAIQSDARALHLFGTVPTMIL